MTVLVGVNTVLGGAVVLADTRLSNTDANGNVVLLRDACQKLVAANRWSVVCVAGSLCPARHLLLGVVRRLRASPVDPGFWMHGELDWLRNDDELLTFLQAGLQHHAAQPGHVNCPHEPVGLLLAWIDWRKEAVDGHHPPELVAVRTPAMTVTRTPGFGAEVIGSGEPIREHLDLAFVTQVANMWHDAKWSAATQCMFVAETVRHRIRQAGITTVGGLYQVTHLSRYGVLFVPYWYWADVEPGFGTYVAMRIEDGRWVQHHRPTNRQIRVASPAEFELLGPRVEPGQHEVFEPDSFLTRDSPGVIPSGPLVLAYAEYDPADVPAQIRASWGDEPPPPLTQRGGAPWDA